MYFPPAAVLVWPQIAQIFTNWGIDFGCAPLKMEL
jgi:hypothetical protein